jgi:hexosaminidase
MKFDAEVEELLLSGHLDPAALPANVKIPASVLPHVVDMVRAGREDVARAVERGARILLSPAAHVYLHRPYADRPTRPEHEDLQHRLGLRAYPWATIAEIFDWDPATLLPIGPNSIAGVEAAMWCETVATGAELEFMLLPRLAGVAERAWSTEVTTWQDHRERLAPQASIWSHRGWTFFSSSLADWSATPSHTPSGPSGVDRGPGISSGRSGR